MVLRARVRIGLSTNLPGPPGSQLESPGRRLCHCSPSAKSSHFYFEKLRSSLLRRRPRTLLPAWVRAGVLELWWVRAGDAEQGRLQPSPALPRLWLQSPSQAAQCVAAPGEKQLFSTAGGRPRQAPQVRLWPIAGVRPAPSQPGADPRPAGEGSREGESRLRHLSSSFRGGRDRTGTEAERSPPPPTLPPRPPTRLRARPCTPPTLPAHHLRHLVSKKEKSTSKRTLFFSWGPPFFSFFGLSAGWVETACTFYWTGS